MIQVKIFYAQNDLRNFSYLIFDKENGKCWVIDPFEEAPIIEYIKKMGLSLKGILNTHHHWDHIKGNPGLIAQFHAPVLKQEKLIQLDESHTLKFMATPGHTLDHQVFIWEIQDRPVALFSGDTLFNSGVGNCKNGGNVDLLFETTQQLQKLPDNVILYPGHDYILNNLRFAKTCEPENKEIDEALKWAISVDTERGVNWNLAQERRVNPFLRLDSPEIKENLDSSSKDERHLFKELRSRRDRW